MLHPHDGDLGRRQPRDDIANRATRDEMLVHLGELSSARQALEGAAFAPGTNATLSVLTDETERPARPREPLPREVLEHMPCLSRSGREIVPLMSSVFQKRSSKLALLA